MRSVKAVFASSPHVLPRVVRRRLIAPRHARTISQASRRRRLLAHSYHLTPELIVVNARLLSRRADGTVAEIRRSPEPKLILIRPVKVLSHAVGNCGADRGRDGAALVKRLPHLVREVLRKSRDL